MAENETDIPLLTIIGMNILNRILADLAAQTGSEREPQ